MGPSHKSARQKPKLAVSTQTRRFRINCKDIAMSFLLRNRSNNSGGRILPTSQVPRVHPPRLRPTSSHDDDASNGSSVHGIRSGNQVLLQRTANPSQSQTQNAGQQAQNQQQHQNLSSQSVISMSEVLADLRVLEQQQRDAQRQLMSARSTKEQRMEQHAALESKLEHLKYSNGEFRAQLRQSRDVLSTSTRALGSRRLVTDKAGSEIRDFEKKLSRGLQSARVNTVCRRKIESLFILTESRLDVLARVKIEAKDKLNNLETSLKAARGREETLRTSIQREAARTQHLASEIASVRAQNSEAENELLAAQNMEASTRTRAQAITSQLNNEKKCIEDNCSELSNQLSHEEEKLSNIQEQTVLLDENFACILQEFHQAKGMIDLPKEHATELGRCDNEKVMTIVETNQATIRELQHSNDAIQDEIEKLLGEIDASVKITASNRAESLDLTKAADEMLLHETSRSEELKMYQSELEEERIVVENLETSAANLLEFRRLRSAKHERALIECDLELEQLQLSIDVIRQGIEQEHLANKTSKDDWEVESAQLVTELETTKEATNAAEAKLDELDLISRDLEAGLQDNLHKELMSIEAQKTKIAQEINEKVSLILRRRPQLGPVVSNFVHDATISKREHIIQALGEIKAKLEGRIRDAKHSTARRKQTRKERKREAESVASLVQQHDETRRKNREKKTAKHKLQKIERRDRTPSIDSDSDRSHYIDATTACHQKESRSITSSKTVKGADFFCPQSHDILSEGESPAQPKSLLSVFSNAKVARSRLSINSALGMDKRVHWKDDGSEDLAVETVREESMSASKIEQRPTVAYFQPSGVHVDGSDDEGIVDDCNGPEHLSKPIGASNEVFPLRMSHDSSESDIDSVIIEESDPTKFRRKERQYGTAKRGLAAIARSKNGSIKSPIATDTGARVLSSKGSTSNNSKGDHQDISCSLKVKLDSRVSVNVGSPMQHDDNVKTGREPKSKTTSSASQALLPQITSTRALGNVTKHHDRDVRAPASPTRKAIKGKEHHSGNTANKSKDRTSVTGSFRQHSKSARNEGFALAEARDLRSVVEKKRLLPRNDFGPVLSRRTEPVITLSRKTTNARMPGSASEPRPGSAMDRTRSKSLCNSNPKFMEAESCHRSLSSKKEIELTSKKRKLQVKSVLATKQTSGLSSSESAPKSRRRKKSWPTQRTTVGMADDSYAFAF